MYVCIKSALQPWVGVRLFLIKRVRSKPLDRPSRLCAMAAFAIRDPWRSRNEESDHLNLIALANVWIAIAAQRAPNPIWRGCGRLWTRRLKDITVDRSPSSRSPSARADARSIESALASGSSKFFSDTLSWVPAIGNSTPHSWEIQFRSSRCFDTPHDREYTFRENTNKVTKLRSVKGSLRPNCL